MRTSLQLAVLGIILTACVRQVCIVDDRDEESSRGVNRSKTFHFDSFDQNQDRFIEFEEFRERMAIKFGFLDLDRSGKLELGRECRDNKWCTYLLTTGKSKVTLGSFLDEATRLFNQVDRSEDRQLDRKEFSRLPQDG